MSVCRRAQEEQRRVFLKQVLTPAAGERLANIALVKPDKARQLENYFLQAAQTGRLGGQVTEEQLKDMLIQFTESERKPKVVVCPCHPKDREKIHRSSPAGNMQPS